MTPGQISDDRKIVPESFFRSNFRGAGASTGAMTMTEIRSTPEELVRAYREFVDDYLDFTESPGAAEILTPLGRPSLVRDTAERIARRHGLAGSGVAQLFAAQALPYLDVARTVEWGEGVLADVLTAEVSGEVSEYLKEAHG